MTLREQLTGKRFGLVLSAGSFGFYGHPGFVDALLAQGLVPAAWAGTSAGGMIAALAPAGLSMKDLKALILSQRREHFWDPDWLGIAIDAVSSGETYKRRGQGPIEGDGYAAFCSSTRRYVSVRSTMFWYSFVPGLRAKFLSPTSASLRLRLPRKGILKP
jgi:hypothetical protein